MPSCALSKLKHTQDFVTKREDELPLVIPTWMPKKLLMSLCRPSVQNTCAHMGRERMKPGMALMLKNNQGPSVEYTDGLTLFISA